MNKHWRMHTDHLGIAWLHFDHADSSLNILSVSALTQLEEKVAELETERPRGLILLSDKKAGFIAGADVNRFREGMGQSGAEQHILQVHELFARIEQLPFPTLALIHGYCLGGGLELALSCRYRLARDDDSTRLGFPEVRLGIFPGYGGTVRSIQRIGALPAMKLMLSGRSIDARQAKKLGLVDQTAPQRQLLATAVAMIEHPRPLFTPGWLQSLADTGPGRALIAPMLTRKTTRHVRADHYPAPFALIDHWRKHGGSSHALYRSEAETVSRLLVGETAQNLIRVFFLQERLKALGAQQNFTPERVHVVGGGIMGGDIAAWCALKGLKVTLQDREAKFLTRAVARAHQLFSRKLKQPRLIRDAMDRLMPDPNGYGVTSESSIS
ncbi:MAG: enoyl-CoA hydratase-related protein [Candidatus Thiodiazotropha sp.]